MLACCGAVLHPWDRHEVQQQWLPGTLRCLIIGENPGDTDSQYFYAPPQSYARDRGTVRRCLLRGLCDQKLISETTLEGFRNAGFLFDHAIRCPLSQIVVKAERHAARRYASPRVDEPVHLLASLSQAVVVWVMGHLACNAVANVCTSFPKERRLISELPYPGELEPGSKFFVSEYFTRWNQSESVGICRAFKRFALERGVFDGL
jgi:hypothetical protein